MVYNSLTEVPHNLKEGFDWLIALKGTDAEKNLSALGAAIHKFLVQKPVGFTEVPALENVKYSSHRFLKKREFRDIPFVKNLIERYNKRMDKNNKKCTAGIQESDYKNVVRAWSATSGHIAKNIGTVIDAYEKFLDDIKIPSQYSSAYSSEATWDASCAKDPEACAVVLVGIAPMLYAGLRSLSEVARTANADGANSSEERRMGEVLESSGYKKPECRSGMSGTHVHKALQPVNSRVLEIIYDLAGFWAFY